MKDHPNATSLFLTCIFAMSGLLAAETENHPAQAKKAAYESEVSQAESLHNQQLELLSSQYATALEKSAADFQKQGDLDSLLALKAEINHFKEAKTVPEKDPDKTHESVVKLRQIYNDSLDKADATKVRTITELTNQYLTYLEELQKKLTQEGKLDQALMVKTETTKIQNFKATIPAISTGKSTVGTTQSTNQKISNATPPSLLLKWDHKRPNELSGSENRTTKAYSFRHEGDNSIANDGTLSLKGGRTTVEDINGKILSSCKASQQWSLVIHFESSGLDQKGPARIFSFSSDSVTRNFTLGQENDQLVLRLRTTITGNNGMNPQVSLGKIEPGEIYKIALTYESEKLNFYLNGKAVPIQQISGDFSNWQECHLVLGNEWKDERPWKGKLYQFSLHSASLSRNEAIASTR